MTGPCPLGRRAMLAGIPVSTLFAHGGDGLPPPEPVNFGTLVLPTSPNAFLAAPPGFPKAQMTLPPLASDPNAAWPPLCALGDRFPRTTKIAEWPERRQAQWVVRSAVLNFPDIVVGEVCNTQAGCGLFLYSRSLFGYYDFGVNRRRVEAWAAALDAALRRR